MALCPDHGGYTGDSCKRCQTKPEYVQDGTTLKLGSLPAKSDILHLASVSPDIDADDQLALYRLERDITVNQQKAQTAQAQFQNFLRAMFEKYGVKPTEYTLDMEKMEFVARAV